MMPTSILVLCFALSSTLGGGVSGKAQEKDTMQACEEKTNCDIYNSKCREAVASSLVELQKDLTRHRNDTPVSQSPYYFIKEKDRNRAVGKLRRKKKYKDGLIRIQRILCEYHSISDNIRNKFQTLQLTCMKNGAHTTARMQKAVCALEMVTDSHCPKSSIYSNITLDNVCVKLGTLETEVVDFVNKTLSALKSADKPKKNRQRRRKVRRRKPQRRRRRGKSRRRRSRKRRGSRSKSSSKGRKSFKSVSTPRISSPSTFTPSAPKLTVQQKGEKRKRSKSRRRSSLKSRSAVNQSVSTTSTLMTAPLRRRREHKEDPSAKGLRKV